MRKLALVVVFLAGCSSAPNPMFDADVLDWSLGPNAQKPYQK
jgi:hypothetical protein